MNIGIVSGKGGTGKTTLATGLARVMNANYVDMDAEEPNGRFFLSPEIKQTEKSTVMIPKHTDKCTFCGLCAEKCRFSALTIIKKTGKFILHEDLCHHCGLCTEICPVEGALVEDKHVIGEIITGSHSTGGFTEGRLRLSEPSSTPLLEQIKKRIPGEGLNILDSSPGASCPVVSVMDTSDYLVLAGEPTPFGLSDLEIVYKLAMEMGKKTGIVINKYIGNDILHDFANKNSIPILGVINYRRDIAENYSRSINAAELIDDELRSISEEIKLHAGINP